MGTSRDKSASSGGHLGYDPDGLRVSCDSTTLAGSDTRRVAYDMQAHVHNTAGEW